MCASPPLRFGCLLSINVSTHAALSPAATTLAPFAPIQGVGSSLSLSAAMAPAVNAVRPAERSMSECRPTGRGGCMSDSLSPMDWGSGQVLWRDPPLPFGVCEADGG